MTKAEQYMPHGMCLLWQPWLVSLHVLSDAAIAVAYFAIPVAIAWFVRRRRDLEVWHRLLALFFVIFISACGLTHVASIVVLWWPYYVAEGLLKALTAVVSVITAVVLPFLVPQLLRIPSPRALALEIEAHRATLAELEAARARLAEQVVETRGDLLETTRRFRTALGNSPVTVFEQDEALTYTWVYNPVLGLSGEALLGRQEADVFAPESALALDGLKLRALATGEPQRRELHLNAGEASGWFDLRVEPMRLRDDRPGLIATCTDITALKVHEAHLSLVMREMNHRSKNVLQIVLGIARQTARGFAVPDAFLVRLGERLTALASAHDVLASANWRGADLSAVIEGQLRHQLDSYSGRITLDGGACELPPEAAHYVGLALHELGSNALKHGALANDAGTVRIHWDVTPGPTAPELSLEWREVGVGQVAAPDRSGFGSTILKVLAARALGGVCELLFEPDGIVWRLKAPLIDRASAPAAA